MTLSGDMQRRLCSVVQREKLSPEWLAGWPRISQKGPEIHIFILTASLRLSILFAQMTHFTVLIYYETTK